MSMNICDNLSAVRLSEGEGWDVHARAFGGTKTLDVDFGEDDEMSQIDVYEDETGFYVLLSFVDEANDAVAYRVDAARR